MRILVVEDDRLLNNTLCYNLDTAGYVVDSALTKSAASNFLTKQDYDLIVLDVNLPDGNGFDFCREVKERRPDTAVIFLTANDMESDMLKGYELGAEDYVTKPFHIEEVMARMQALMRRNSGLASQIISLPPFQVDLSRRELSVNDEVIKLTAFEYTIMETLIRNNGKVVSKDSLMLQLYPDAELRESHTIDVLMGRLRKKIQAQYPQEVITTVRGQGYLFELR